MKNRAAFEQLASLLLAATFLFAIEHALALDIPITVKNPTATARSREGASGGIPLPDEAYRPSQKFALFDAATNREIPVQTLPLVVHDGFMRWVLVDFKASVPASGETHYVLRTAAPTIQPAEQLSVVTDPNGVEIDTSVIRFRVDKTSTAVPFQWVRRGVQPIVSGGEIKYTDGLNGTTYNASAPSSIEVKYAGPLRATVIVRGNFAGDSQSRLGYVMRITAYAGDSRLAVKYSLTNSNPDQFTYRQIKENSLRLTLASPTASSIIGAKDPLTATGDVWMHQGLDYYAAYQDIPAHTKVGQGTTIAWTGNGKADAPQGWIASGGAFVTDVYFADDPSRKLAREGNSLVLSPIVPRFDGPTNAKGAVIGQPFRAPYRTIYDWSHLSTHYVLDFAPPQAPADLASLATLTKRPLHVMAEPSWYFDTEALPVGKFTTQAEEMRAYDTWGWTYKASNAPAKFTSTQLNTNRHIRTIDNHFDVEQDVLLDIVLMYLRTGSLAFLENARSWNDYSTDLLEFRTDGWSHKDGGIWWPDGGPAGGSRPQRVADPVTGIMNRLKAPWADTFTAPQTEEWVNDLWYLSKSKQCYCHSWGPGLVAFAEITGDTDSLESAIDSVEESYDTLKRAFRRVPGELNYFYRDVTRAIFNANSLRTSLPHDAFAVEASDWLTSLFLRRPRPEPRGLPMSNDPLPMTGSHSFKGLSELVGQPGIDKMNELGVVIGTADDRLTDTHTGQSWYPVQAPAMWWYPDLSIALEQYYRLTGNKDAYDYVVAYGQAVAKVMYQERHGNLAYEGLLVDFPKKGVALDYASWQLPPTSTSGEGVVISGYLGQHHPDVVARAYEYSGEPFLKQRAYDYWNHGSHRAYHSTSETNLGAVSMWANVSGNHAETVQNTGMTFYIFSHPRADTAAPAAINNVVATRTASGVRVSFTAPADVGAGVARYQIKFADRPIATYDDYVTAFNENREALLVNWFLAGNVGANPTPAAPGSTVIVDLPDVPESARYIAVRSYDGAKNMSALSNNARIAGVGPSAPLPPVNFRLR